MYYVFAGVGNITPFAEFNFFCDPDAAFIVLEEAGIPIHLTPFEICLKDGTFPYVSLNALLSLSSVYCVEFPMIS